MQIYIYIYIWKMAKISKSAAKLYRKIAQGTGEDSEFLKNWLKVHDIISLDLGMAILDLTDGVLEGVDQSISGGMDIAYTPPHWKKETKTKRPIIITIYEHHGDMTKKIQTGQILQTALKFPKLLKKGQQEATKILSRRNAFEEEEKISRNAFLQESHRFFLNADGEHKEVNVVYSAIREDGTRDDYITSDFFLGEVTPKNRLLYYRNGTLALDGILNPSLLPYEPDQVLGHVSFLINAITSSPSFFSLK